MYKMEELLLKICGRAISSREEISSIEMVLLMNELNQITGKQVSIFDLIETDSINEIELLYGVDFK